MNSNIDSCDMLRRRPLPAEVPRGSHAQAVLLIAITSSYY